ncbi:hypothetical protein [Cellulomonas edaphi]|uniref:DUF4367 domain-containing protein n=1 Tax=Cellulomonas edaphi TaxID=3053468 RepID=A0ABT7S401_9CELL|nr:hypothetical protein [Cellulomons edaphi]MDM7830353.1 hypothetical protein [Cellulomons edaphi]
MRRVLVTLLAAGLLGACGSGGDEARPVTSEEAQTLAQVRFRNYDAGARVVAASTEDAQGPVHLDGWVDFVDHVGYASLDQEGAAPSLLTWDGESAALAPAAAATAPLPPPAELASAQRSPLDASASAEHALLLVLLDLGSDRPENPLLLQQGGARWLRSDEVQGAPVDVFTATSAGNARYWVDGDGLLRRAEVLVGGEWVTIDLGDSLDPSRLDALVPAEGS